MQRTPDKDAHDGFLRGFHGIPDDEKLKMMSFIELSAELVSCDNGSPKFIVLEREIKKHIARDQSEAARSNILLGALIAGFFTIVGAIIGAVLKTCPSCQQVTSDKAIQQPDKVLLSPASASVNLAPANKNTQSAKTPLIPASQVGPLATDRSTEKN